MQICCLPRVPEAPLKFPSSASPGLSDLVHPCEYGTMAAPRTMSQTQRHAHTLSRESSPCLMQILRDGILCEYWGMEFSSVLFCSSINVQGRSWVLCSQRPQWDGFKNSGQGPSTSKKPHSRVPVTWTPRMWWLFLNPQNLPTFSIYITLLESPWPKPPCQEGKQSKIT